MIKLDSDNLTNGEPGGSAKNAGNDPPLPQFRFKLGTGSPERDAEADEDDDFDEDLDGDGCHVDGSHLSPRPLLTRLNTPRHHHPVSRMSSFSKLSPTPEGGVMDDDEGESGTGSLLRFSRLEFEGLNRSKSLSRASFATLSRNPSNSFIRDQDLSSHK